MYTQLKTAMDSALASAKPLTAMRLPFTSQQARTSLAVLAEAVQRRKSLAIGIAIGVAWVVVAAIRAKRRRREAANDA